MITLLCLLFWWLVARSRYAPWDEKPGEVWNAFCIGMVFLTIGAVGGTFVIRVVPLLEKGVRFMAHHLEYLF